MRVGSLFAGIGGFDLGFERAGFSVAWHAEIDKAASAILRYRWPDVPNLGDVTKIDGAAIEPVDVICGGFPCQDLSVAGKRAGFTGKRSVLAFEFLRIVREMREATDGRAPTFVVLENVPGLFSSSGGRDFGALLDALGELRPLDIAWRVLDSRYFGVAQRRRRVFVVVDFGGERCDEILALREGLRGDSPASRAAREEVAGTLGGGSSERGWPDDLDRCGAFVTPAPCASMASGPGHNKDEFIVAHTLRAEGFDASEDGTGRGVPLVADPLCANEQRTYTHEGNTFRLRNVIPFDTTQVTSATNRSRCEPGDPAGTLAKGGHAPAVAFQVLQQNTGRGGNRQVLGMDEPHPTMNRRSPNALASSFCVRRLTPRECSRLQSFPDSWMEVGYADAEEANAREILHCLWRSTYSWAREERSASKPPPLLSPEILLAGVYGGWVSWEVAFRCAARRGAVQGKDAWAEGFVRGLRACAENGSSPYRRESFEQLARELGRPLSELPLEEAQALEAVRSADVREGETAVWPMRPSLTTAQEGRSAGLADGPRYGCLGNAVTVSVAEWVARRMAEVMP